MRNPFRIVLKYLFDGNSEQALCRLPYLKTNNLWLALEWAMSSQLMGSDDAALVKNSYNKANGSMFTQLPVSFLNKFYRDEFLAATKAHGRSVGVLHHAQTSDKHLIGPLDVFYAKVQYLEIEMLAWQWDEAYDSHKPTSKTRAKSPVVKESQRDSKTATLIKKILAEQLGVEESQVTNEKAFEADLGADSLDTVELVIALEDAFGISIPNKDAEKMRTVQDAIDYTEKAISKNAKLDAFERDRLPVINRVTPLAVKDGACT